MGKPNIVYLFCDELRCDALSCYPGSPKGIRTPNLDRLAAEGTIFEQCFCNSPVCVPSRYSLLTGLYPETTGVYHNEAAREEYAKAGKFLTIPEVLAEEGYRTANFGKMHLPGGVEPFEEHDPEGSKIKDPGLCTDIIATRGIKSPVGGVFPEDIPYPPKAVTENAIRWMKEQTGPYMVRISWLQPHTPVVPLPAYADLYDDVDFPVRDRRDARLSRFEQRYIENVDDGLTDQQAKRAKICYYGMVRWIDDQVGMVLDTLKEQGLFRDTILVFGADHGAMLGENRRYAKQNFACWSHRVPLIITYKRKLRPGVRRRDICENLDLGKTLFSLAGVHGPAQFRGRDLFSEETAEYVYGTIGYGEKGSFTFPNKKHGLYTENRGWPRRACIRSLDYRFDMNIRMDGEPVGEDEEDLFLADLRDDPAEQFNVAGQAEYSEVLRDLRQKLLDHIETERVRGER